MVMIPALRDASEDVALHGAPLAVYLWTIHHLELHGYRPCKTQALALTLGLRRQAVGRALTLLVARGYLAEGPRHAGVRTFRVFSARDARRGPQNVHGRRLTL
jgi:hypothetical protein